MQLSQKKILLTGAAGGIGEHLARQLLQHGADVMLLDRDTVKLEALLQDCQGLPGKAYGLNCDLADAQQRSQVILRAQQAMGGIDLLINNAGVLQFCQFDHQSEETIALTMMINSLVPMQLSRQVLPLFQQQQSGAIVNIGSVFGHIAFPHYASYSASKFALRGFSEALRRELADTPIQVLYIAPRTTGTALNSQQSLDLAKAQGNAVDHPAMVAQQVIKAIMREAEETVIGQPEGLFCKINACLPKLVNLALRQQTRAAQQLLNQENGK